MRLLIVDDHRAVAEAFAMALEHEHQVIDVLDDCRAVRPWLTRHLVDVVLLDGTLPGCDLFELIRAVRIGHPNTKVILMTIHVHGSDWPGLRRMGAWACVSKTLPL